MFMPAPWITRIFAMTGAPLNCSAAMLKLCPSSRHVLRGAQPEEAGLDEPADIPDRPTPFEPAGRAACRVEPRNDRAVRSLDPPVPVDRDAAHRIGDAGAD